MDNSPGIKLLWISELTGDQFGLLAEVAAIYGLKELGVDISVLCRPGSRFITEFRSRGIPFHEKHPESKWDRKETKELRQVILDGGYNIVHAFNNKAIIQALRATRGLDVRIFTYRGFAGHIHWYDPGSYLTHLNPRISGIWCVSKVVKENLDKQFIGRKAPTRVIYKGHDPAWYEGVKPIGKETLGLAEDDFAVVLVANYRKYKGVDDLVRSLEYIPEDLPIKLLIVGRGMEDAGLQKLVSNIPGKERVHFLGFRKDVLEVVASCDLAVNASWTEAFSKTLFEAVYMDVPCAATAVSGNLELIIDEDHGWQVPVKNPKGMANAIIDAFHHPMERQRRALNARKYFEKNFRPEETAGQLFEWYGAVLSA